MKIRGKFLVLALACGISLTALSAQAAPTAIISGRVVDQLNRAVANTTVSVLQAGSVVAQVASNATGAYSVAVEPGAYALRFVPPTTANATLNAYNVIAPTSKPLTVQLTKPTPGRVAVTGSVALSNGGTLARDTTMYFDGLAGTINAQNTFRITPTAGRQSQLVLKGANTGTFSFSITGAPTIITQDSFFNVVVPVQTQRVRVVTNDGVAVANATIEAGQGSWGSLPAAMEPLNGFGPVTGTWGFRTVTDAQGWATISTVTMAQPSAAGYRVTPPAGVPYLVEQFQAVTGAGDITLTLTQRVALMNGTVKNQNGIGQRGVTVFYGGVNADTTSAGTFSKSVPAGLLGNFELSYSVGSEATTGFRYWITPFGQAPAVLNASQPTSLVVGIDNVTVKVVDGFGLPVANANVRLTDSEGYAPRGTWQLTGSTRPHQATFTSNGITNAQGLVTLPTLRFDKEILGVVVVTPPVNSSYSPEIARALVGGGAAVNVALPRPTVPVTGSIVTSDGTPLLNSTIRFGDSQGNAGAVAPGANGTFAMTVPVGTLGRWSFECATGILRDLTTPLCVTFTADYFTISSATSRDFVVPTYKTPIRVVDASGKGIPDVLVKMSAGHNFGFCAPSAVVSVGLTTSRLSFMASATTDANGLAQLPTVQIARPCTGDFSIIPSTSSRYQSRDLLLTVGDGAESVIVLSIPVPTISSATTRTTATGKLITLTGTGFLGSFNVTIDGVAVTGYSVISDTSITIPVSSAFAGGTVLIENGGGSATIAVPSA